MHAAFWYGIEILPDSLLLMSTDYFEQHRQEMLPFIPVNRRRVLEVGCSSGFFSAALNGTEETWGIEPSRAAEEAAKRLTRVIRGTFDDAKERLPKGYFDVVICNDVIEHMPNHEKFFRGILDHLAVGGVLVGSIPNVRFYNNLFELLLEKDWLYTDDGILDRTHVAFFTQKSLRRTLEKNGFQVARLEGINTDFLVRNTGRARAYRSFARMLSTATLGYFEDIRHLQFAFQAIPNKRAEVS